jgi:hypothetical protein
MPDSDPIATLLASFKRKFTVRVRNTLSYSESPRLCTFMYLVRSSIYEYLANATSSGEGWVTPTL